MVFLRSKSSSESKRFAMVSCFGVASGLIDKKLVIRSLRTSVTGVVSDMFVCQCLRMRDS